MSGWQTIETAPKDRFILLFSPQQPRWAGNMDVGKWFGDEDSNACVWSCGGPNGGLELTDTGWGDYTHWMDLPADPVS